MESKQLTYNSKQSVLTLISTFYKRMGEQKVNNIRFEKNDCIDYLKLRVVNAMEDVIKTDLECDLSITDEFLEKVKLYVNGVY